MLPTRKDYPQINKINPKYGISVYNDFTTGINDTVPPDNMLDTEIRICQNATARRRGGFKLRDGTTMLVSTMASYGYNVTQAFEWQLSDGSTKFVAVINNKLCDINLTTGAKTEKLTIQRDYIAYIIHLDTLWFSDGNEFYYWGWYQFTADNASATILINDIVYNYPASAGGGTSKHYYKAVAGHGVTDLTAEDFSVTARWTDVTDGVIPNDIRAVAANPAGDNDLEPVRQCKYMIYHPLSNRMAIIGGIDDPYGLYYSELYEGTYGFGYFKAASVLYPTSAKGPAVGLVVFGDSIVVGYKTGWFSKGGTAIGSDSTWVELPIPVGATNNESISLVPNGLVFYRAGEGLFYINPLILDTSTVTVPSDQLYVNLTDGRLEELVAGIVHPETSRVLFFNNSIYFAYGDDAANSYNNKVLVLDWDLKSFIMQIDGWQINTFIPSNDGSLYFGSDNYILKAFDGLTDVAVEDGTTKPIHMKVLTKAYNLAGVENSYNVKFLEQIYLQTQQPTGGINNLRVTIISGFTDTQKENINVSGSIWGSAWGFVWGSSEFATYKSDVDVTAYRHQIKIETAAFDYETSDVSANIVTDNVFKNYTYAGTGTLYHLYRAVSDLGEVVFATEDFTDTDRWEDITASFTQNEFFLYNLGFKFRIGEDNAPELG